MKGETLESYVTKKRDKKAALKLLRKSPHRHSMAEEFVADRLRTYEAAMKEFGRIACRRVGQWPHYRAENSYQPFRR